MAIFPRRIIQEIINENSLFISYKKLNNIVINLNLLNEDSLAHEWELVVLNAFSKLGKVYYERQKRNKRSIDLLFISRKYPYTKFVAEISTISDEGLNDENPLSYFLEQFQSHTEKLGFTFAGFNIRVEGEQYGDYPDQKMKLLLPPKKNMHKFIKEYLTDFIIKAKSNPQNSDHIEIKEKDINLKINYDPNNQRTILSGHPSYKVPYSLTRNPLYNRIQKKSKQLKNSGFHGYKGMILCDGDSNIIKDSMYGTTNFNRKQIIDYFFRSNQSVNFIILVYIVDKPEGFSLVSTKATLETEIYINYYSRNPINKETYYYFDEFKKYIPIPRRNTATAMNMVKSKKPYRSNSLRGGFTMGDNHIKISSRSLVELLAGTISLDEFQGYDKRIEKRNFVKHFFNRQIQNGNVINEIDLEKNLSEDDDWITLRFAGPDPAMHPFQIEKRTIKKRLMSIIMTLLKKIKTILIKNE